MLFGFIRPFLKKVFWKKVLSGITTSSILLANVLLPYSIPGIAHAQEASGSAEMTAVTEAASSPSEGTITESATEKTSEEATATSSATPVEEDFSTATDAAELTPEATPALTPTIAPEVIATDFSDATASAGRKTGRSRSELSSAFSSQGEEELNYVPGEVIVKFKKDKIDTRSFVGKTQAFLFEKRFGLEKKDEAKTANTQLFRSKKTTNELVEQLKADPSVEVVEPNYRRYPSVIPTNDADRAKLWGLDNTGQTVNGTAGLSDADIDAPEAWNISNGSSGTIVAVVDTGVAYNHPDLAPNMWDGSACKDETGAALGGCNHGYDFESNDKTPLPDKSTHGTHVAGIIAAAKNNTNGVIGVAPQAKIMAIKSDLTIAGLIKSIDFATQNGAKVINASYGGSDGSALEQEAINRFRSAGGIFVAAAGNGGTDGVGDNNDTTHHYPSDYTLDNIISVAATDQNDNLTSFSNYGAASVDVAAPGTNIYSTLADATVLNETFETVTAPAVPAGWAKGGTNNKWATYDFGTNSVLYGQVPSNPYDNNTNSTITTPAYNLANASGSTIGFVARCDTEYDPANWWDYMTMEFSADGGSTFNPMISWDESYLDWLNGDTSDAGIAAAYMGDFSIPSQYLTNNFKVRFTWHTDESINNFDGCAIDNLLINKIGNGSDEKYGYLDGTSMAAPYVTGLAALVWGYRSELTPAQVKARILDSGDAKASLSGKTTSGKRINAYNALSGLNNAPTTSNGSVSLNEDTSVIINLSASDPDGNPLTYSFVTVPSHGSLSSYTGNTVTYTPTANYSGSDSFTFKANDGYVDSNVSTVTITVLPVNDRPIANPDIFEVYEDNALPITLTGSDFEGSALSFVIATQPTNGTLGVLSGSSVVYTPAAGYNGNDSFTFTVSDGSLTSDPATVSIIVSAVNDAPVLGAIGNKSVNELATLTFTAAATDDSSTLTYSLTGAPVGASINPSTGVFTFTPTEAQGPGTYTFTVRVTDGANADAEEITVTVNEINVAPTAGDVSISTSEDTIKEITLVGADTDLPAQGLHYQLVTNPSSGTLGAISNGKVNYTPTLNFVGSDSFTYKVGDGVTESAPATVTITVTAANDTPVAVDDATSTNEDTPLSIDKTTLLANDTDPDGTSPTVVSVGNAVHGIVTILTATVVFSPDLDYNGQASFDYTITDGSLTDTGTVIVTVTAVNDAPVVVNDTAATGEDAQLSIAQSLILTNDTDKDGDSLTVTSVANPIHGAVLISGANIVFTPEVNYSGAASFDYTVSDGTVSDTGTVNITVTPADDAPVLSAIGNKSVDELTSLSFTAVALDPDNTVIYSLIGAPTGASVNANSGAFSFTPTEAQGPGVFQFTVRATGGTASDDELITVTVNEVNIAPTAGDVSVAVIEDTQKVITLSAADSDIPVQTINYFLVTNPSYGTLNAIHDGVVDYTPNSNYSGSDSFTYKVNDSNTDSNTATVTINVTAVNDRPVAVDDAATVDEDIPLTIAKSVLLDNDTDADGDTLIINAVTNAVHGIVTQIGNNIIFSADADYSGPASFDYTLSDGILTDIGHVEVTVNAVNDTPIAVAQHVTVEEDSAAATNIITLVGTDKESSSLTFTKVTDPTHGVLGVVNGNQITYAPNADYTGSDSFTFMVSDGSLNSTPATVYIDVVPFNDPPVLASIGDFSVDELSLLTFTANATDSDSSDLTYSLVGAPAGAVIHATTGVFTWTPTESQGGSTYNFTVVVSDETKSDSEAIAVTVNEVNTAPIASGQAVTTDEDSAKDIVLTAVDTDVPASTLTFGIVDQPAHGSVALTGNTATYTPSANYYGSDVFTYKINDGTADSNTAIVSITVSPVNDLPTAENKTASTNEDTVVFVTLSGADIETAAGDLQYAFATQPAHGSVTLVGDTATYTPAANYHGVDSFTYKVNDGATYSNAATATVTVLAVNDAPIAIDEAATASEDTMLTVSQSFLLANDADVDEDTLGVIGVANGVNGTVNMVGTDITFMPAPNYSGTAGFDYTVSDGTVTDTATVTIAVIAVNDAPFLNPIGNKSVDELSLLTFTAVATDPDSTVTYALTGAPAGAVIGLTSGIFTFTPTEAQGAGVYGFTVSATDGINTDTEAITVTVNEVNIAPVANDVTVSTGEDTAVSVTLSATDADLPEQAINYFLVTNPTHGSLDAISSGTVNYTPNSNYSGSDSFTYKVNDGDSDSNTATVTITVSPVNDTPIAVGDTASVNEDAALTIAKSDLTINDTDTENDTLTVIGVNNAIHGTVVISGANVVFTPVANYFGTASFVYTVSDGDLTATGTVMVTVTSVNDTPVAGDVLVTTGQEDAIAVLLTASDVDGDVLHYTIVTGPANGTLSGVTGSTVTYTPSIGFHGTDTFTYKAADGITDSNIATVTITVNPPPVISNESSSFVKETSVKITWTTDHVSTSRVVYDTVSHATPSAAPNYGYANSTIEDATKVTAHVVEITGLNAGVTYYYRVISHGSPETYSDEQEFTTTKAQSSGGGTSSDTSGDGRSDGRGSVAACTDGAPNSSPRLISAVAGSNSVTLTWSSAADPVTYYLVTYGTESGLQQYGNPNVGGSGTRSYTVRGLSGGSTYYFKVRAGNGCMPGEFSNELSAQPYGQFIEEAVAADFQPGVLGVVDDPSLSKTPATGSVEPQNALNTSLWQRLLLSLKNSIKRLSDFFASLFNLKN